MNARTEVERHAGQDLPWSPTVGAEPPCGGATSALAPTVTKPWSEVPTDESRHSVDPMHATDRYRLVVPYTLRV